MDQRSFLLSTGECHQLTVELTILAIGWLKCFEIVIFVATSAVVEVDWWRGAAQKRRNCVRHDYKNNSRSLDECFTIHTFVCRVKITFPILHAIKCRQRSANCREAIYFSFFKSQVNFAMLRDFKVPRNDLWCFLRTKPLPARMRLAKQ